MEKLSYIPLVKHLKEHEEYYSNLLAQYELHHGTVDGNMISSWMINSIQPLVERICKGDEGKIFRIHRALFNSLLELKGNGQLIDEVEHFQKAWRILEQVPEIFSTSPGEILKIINQGLKGILTFQREKAQNWIEQMHSLVVFCSNQEEIKSLARILAWFNGLAHLRTKALQNFETLSDRLKQEITSLTGLSLENNENFGEPWGEIRETRKYGGFIGFEDGIFIQPPLIGLIDGLPMATDSREIVALFNDSFGTVLLKGLNYPSENILSSVTKTPNSYINRYDDVSSSVVINKTLIFTRKSSYQIYISPLS